MVTWSPDVPAATGLRRVDWVRLVVDHDAVRAEAVGVGYRLPADPPHPLFGGGGADGRWHTVGHSESRRRTRQLGHAGR